jgi:hypothetical protein
MTPFTAGNSISAAVEAWKEEVEKEGGGEVEEVEMMTEGGREVGLRRRQLRRDAKTARVEEGG